jgi:arabinogalactan endo-1,4-beta-galactosidase
MMLPRFLAALVLTLALRSHAEFARGADVSWITQMEANHKVFHDEAGIPGESLEILRNFGINSVRLRVWVNPDSGWSGKADVVAKAKRAKAKGMRIMINFHYSDHWTDPGTQKKPAAWESHDLSMLVKDVESHTADVLMALRDSGVTPEWVQIGNETNDGMLWQEGRAMVSMTSFAALVQSGAKATKVVFPKAKVVVHLSNAYDNVMYRWIFDGLKANGVDWDVVGMSHYPEIATWRATTAQALANMQDMVSRYGKDVVISETGMDWKAEDSCHAMLKLLQSHVASLPGGRGLGVFYWEPLAYWGWNGYQKGAFDDQGHPTRALEAFREMMPVAVAHRAAKVKSAVTSRTSRNAAGRKTGTVRRWRLDTDSKTVR